MKRWILCLYLLPLVLMGQQTGNQALSSSKDFQRLSDHELRIVLAYYLAGGVSATVAVSNAVVAGYLGVDDKLLLAIQAYYASNGLLVKSNTLASLPTLSPGDAYLWSSNGILYSINSSPSGTLTTNKLAP